MFSFGWVTQSKITKNIRVNNILTRLIKEYLIKKEFERVDSEEITNKNCYKKDTTYVAIYTRHIATESASISWAVYDYVKKLAKKENVVLFLGVLFGETFEGQLYMLNSDGIKRIFDSKSLYRGKYVMISASDAIFVGDFQEENELHDLIDQALGV